MVLTLCQPTGYPIILEILNLTVFIFSLDVLSRKLCKRHYIYTETVILTRLVKNRERDMIKETNLQSEPNGVMMFANKVLDKEKG